MVRKQVYIEPEHEEFLKRRSAELGITEAELIRRAIVRLAAEPMPRVRRDRHAWEEALAFMRERMELKAPQTGRTWTREEIYDYRWDRRHRSD